MRNTAALLSSINSGIRFQDAERGINTYIPIDKDGNWKFPERASDFELNGYPFIFKGYSVIEMKYDQNGVTAYRTTCLKNISFGSTLNINDHDYRTFFDFSEESTFVTYGGIFACYEIPSFLKFQFHSADAVFWKQDVFDDVLCDFYKIPCYQYNYLLAPPLALEYDTIAPELYEDPIFSINGFSYDMRSFKDALDFTIFTQNEGPYGIDGITTITNGMTIDHESYVIKQPDPLKQNVYVEGYQWCSPGSSIMTVQHVGGLTGTINNDDTVCAIICTPAQTSTEHVFRARIYGCVVFDTNNQVRYEFSGNANVSADVLENNYLIELYPDDTEYITFYNTNDPIDGAQVKCW